MKTRFTAIAALLAVVLGLAACSNESLGFEASAEGVEVTVAGPPAIDAEITLEAIEAIYDIPLGNYLMLRPSEIYSDGELPESGAELRITLPADLPEGVAAFFAYYDNLERAWVPIATEVDGRKLSASVDHFSLWTVIVTGAQDTIEAIADTFQAVGETIGDETVNFVTWWSTEGPGEWIYRIGGMVLGLQGEAPVCDTGPLPEWVDEVTIAKLEGIPENNQSVLRCVGVDPSSPELLQVKAVANRGYGFAMDIADGVTPHNMKWSLLSDYSQSMIVGFSNLLAARLNEQLFLDPRDTILGTTEVSFSVSWEDVAALEPGEHLVSFAPLAPFGAVMSYGYRWALEWTSDQIAAMTGVWSVLEACYFTQVPDTDDLGEIAAAFTNCTGILDEVYFESLLDDIASGAAQTDIPELQYLATDSGKKALKTVRGMLKWIDAVSIGLTLIDYAGERTDDVWYIDVEAADIPSWADAAGTYCSAADPDGMCYTIDYPRIWFDESDIWMFDEKTHLIGDCIWANTYRPAGQHGGSNVTFCPAGTATPYDESKYETSRGALQSLYESEGDDASRARIFNGGWVGPGGFALVKQGESR